MRRSEQLRLEAFMLQLIGLIVALVGCLLPASSGPVNSCGISGGGPVGRPHPIPTPAIVLPAGHDNTTTPH
jgi:hypothetical protein